MKMPPLLPSLLRRGQGWLMGHHPHPLLLRRRGAIFRAVAHARPLTGTRKPRYWSTDSPINSRRAAAVVFSYTCKEASEHLCAACAQDFGFHSSKPRSRTNDHSRTYTGTDSQFGPLREVEITHEKRYTKDLPAKCCRFGIPQKNRCRTADPHPDMSKVFQKSEIRTATHRAVMGYHDSRRCLTLGDFSTLMGPVGIQLIFGAGRNQPV